MNVVDYSRSVKLNKPIDANEKAKRSVGERRLKQLTTTAQAEQLRLKQWPGGHISV